MVGSLRLYKCSNWGKNESQRIKDSKLKDLEMAVLKNGKSSIVSIYNAQIC